MDRLTMYTTCGYESINPVDLCLDEYSNINFERILDKLGEYEDAEEQGLLLKLPCRVGDVVYAIQGNDIAEIKIDGIAYINHGAAVVSTISCVLYQVKEFGEIVFLTKEEAEKKLKERQENINGR